MAFLFCSCGARLQAYQLSKKVLDHGEWRKVEYKVGSSIEAGAWQEVRADDTDWMEGLPEGAFCIQCHQPIELDPLEESFLVDKRVPGISANEFHSELFIERLRQISLKERSEMFVHHIPPREASYGSASEPLTTELSDALVRMDIKSLYSHQAEAYNAVRAGKNIVLVTQTSSGKTLSFNLPILHSLLEQPRARAIYLFPTKALADDQLNQFSRWSEPHTSFEEEDIDDWFERDAHLGEHVIRAGRLDGDTPPASRGRILAHGRIIISNPDMIHHSVLKLLNATKKSQPHIGEMLKNLRFVVIDEMHYYRGAFGSHVGLLMRRLRAICASLGNYDIQFILCSATIESPERVASDLTGLPEFHIIDHDGSAQRSRDIVFWNPGSTLDTGVRKAPVTDALLIAKEALVHNGRVVRTIAFQGSRLQTKVTTKYIRDVLAQTLRLSKERSRGLALAAFYNGMMPMEERKSVIEAVRSNDIHIVIATNALEVGIDIGDLSLALLIGYPGSKAAFSQQIGRVGRKGEGVAVMIMEDEPLQQYYMNNPGKFLEKPPEVVRIDVHNSQLLEKHLSYLRDELGRPLTEDDVLFFVNDPTQARSRATSTDPDEERCSLRTNTTTSTSYKLVNKQREVLLEDIDEWTAFRDLHAGSIYWTPNEKVYRIDSIHRKTGEIIAKKHSGEMEYYTQSTFKDMITPVEVKNQMGYSSDVRLSTGTLEIGRTVFGYVKTYFSTHQQEKEQLESPLTTTFETEGVYITLSSHAIQELERLQTNSEECLGDLDNVTVEGALRAVEHLMLSAIPDVVICDSNDVASFSGASLPSFNHEPVIGFYASASGGMGTSMAIADHILRIVNRAIEVVENCACVGGCPACIQHSHKDNEALSKRGARILLLNITNSLEATAITQ